MGCALTEKKTERPASARSSGPDLQLRHTQDGKTFLVPMRPGLMVYGAPSPEGRHTLVYNEAWSEAQRYVSGFTEPEVLAGWPKLLWTAHLAALQFPFGQKCEGDSRPYYERQNFVMEALGGACQRGEISCKPIIRRERELSGRTPPEETLQFHLDPQTFLGWLWRNELKPSRFIVAWVKANRVAVPEWATEPPPASAAIPATIVPEVQAKNNRPDLLDPLVQRAIREAGADASPAAVFNLLKQWAEQPDKPPPLKGVTETEEIQWENANGAWKELTRQALGARVRRARARKAR